MRRDRTVATEQERAQTLARIAKYRTVEADVRARASSADFSVATLDLTARLLRLNPEHYTAWNVRRRCILAASPAPPLVTIDPSPTARAAQDDSETDDRADDGAHAHMLRSEIAFTVPLLLTHPKCYWIWNHRLWTLNRCVVVLPPAAARPIWEDELALIGQMLTRDRRNFHAWGYRRRVVARLESPDLQLDLHTASHPIAGSLAQSEFDYTTRMIRVDLSNFSAWHSRSRLLVRLLQEKEAEPDERRRSLESEFDTVHDALDVGPEDQSIWLYHQFLMSNILPPSPSALARRATLDADEVIAPGLTANERASLVRREVGMVRELLPDYDDVKWIYETLLEYALAAAGDHADRAELASWNAKLRALDPLRRGRWDDLDHALFPSAEKPDTLTDI